MTSPRSAAITALALAVSLAACTSVPGEPDEPDLDAATGASVADVATELVAPWSLAPFQDSVLVSERDSARIFEITAAREIREVTTVGGVRTGGEGGLLGLAVDPAGEHLYAYSTAESGNRVQRYAIGGAAGGLTLSSPVDILTGLPAAGNHNGGRVAFGPDGMLYVTVGDAGDRDAAQDRESLAGKILRVEPDGGIPSDNPFPDSPVYSLGHRNPQGLAWAADGRMFASEFGQNTWDELNLIEAGANYGWPLVEGVAEDDRFVDPVQVWSPADASPSGLTAVGDTLYLANLRGERLRAIPVDDPGTSVEYLTAEYGRLRDVVLAPDGRLWIATSNRDGRGDARPGDDRILAVDLEAVGGEQ